VCCIDKLVWFRGQPGSVWFFVVSRTDGALLNTLDSRHVTCSQNRRHSTVHPGCTQIVALNAAAERRRKSLRPATFKIRERSLGLRLIKLLPQLPSRSVLHKV
jgi:hypothetical protein